MQILYGIHYYRMSVIFMIAFSLVIGSVQALMADTSIVAIRVDNEVVVGADSKRTIYDAAHTHVIASKSACKIHKGDGFFFAAAGYSENPKRGFSLVSLLRESERTSGTIRQRVGRFELFIKEKFTKLLEQFRQEAPSVYQQQFRREPSALTVIFFGIENGLSFLLMRDFKIKMASPEDPVQIAIEQHNCPGDCPNGAMIALLGKHDAIDRFLNGQPLNYWSRNPEDVVPSLIELEIACHTMEVGPPVDVVQLDKAGAHWIQQKIECEQ